MAKSQYTYQCIVYDENFKSSHLKWLSDKANEKKVSWVVLSPLHDKDLKSDGSGYKKAHRHIIIKYRNDTSYDLFREEFEKGINAVVAPLYKKGNSVNSESIVTSDSGSLTYLVHMSKDSMYDDTKYKYDANDIICFGAMTKQRIKRYIEKNKVDDMDNGQILWDIRCFVKNNNIKYFDDLLECAYDNYQLWYEFLMKKKNADYIMMIIKSIDFKSKQENFIKTEIEYSGFDRLTDELKHQTIQEMIDINRELNERNEYITKRCAHLEDLIAKCQ